MNASESGARPDDRVPSDARPHVLIADDDYDVRDILARMFVGDGFEVTLVSNGARMQDAVLESEQDGDPPDVLVVDHMMPGGNGLDAVNALRARGFDRPVVLITGVHRAASEGRAQGTTVLEKPFDPLALRALVAGWVGSAPRVDTRSAWSVDDMDVPRCSSCGSRVRLVWDASFNHTCMCASCRARASPPDDDDELGVID